MTRHAFSLGTHNLHDEAGQPTRFADLIMFTEAIPHRVDQLEQPRPDRHALAARARLRARGYAVLEVPAQPDLIIAWRRRVFRRIGPIDYERVIDGRPHVTPNRGTAWLPLRHRDSGVRLAAVWEHRINAAFPPFVRGEPEFRRQAWLDHTRHTWNVMTTLHAGGWLVVAGGDDNTPQGVRAYPSTTVERGDRFDRLALWQPPSGNRQNIIGTTIGAPEYLSRQGSDHPRLRAEVTVTVR